MKTIKIKFCDFWKHWNQQDNFIVNILKKRYNIEFSDNPDYVFFSNFNEDFEHMDYNNCVKIFYTQENLVPDFNYADYGIGFDDIIYGDRYIRYPIYLIPERYGRFWNLMKRKHLFENSEEVLDRGFCSFVVSNGNADEIRNNAFEALNKYKEIHSGGRYKNNIGLPDGVLDKLEFASKYKFSLCFENTSHPGYSTEKIIEAFAAKTIPIYWGDPNITDIFNPKSFIDVTSCKTIEEIVQKVKEVDSDDGLYLKMLGTKALNEQSELYYEEAQQKLEKFLYNIFEQEPQDALRRNLFFWGAEYHKRYFSMRKVYLLWKYSIVNRVGVVLRSIKTTIKKICGKMSNSVLGKNVNKKN